MRIEGLILAAGLSSRAPGFKMTLPLNGRTVLGNSIEAMLKYCDRIVVVGGYCYEKLIPICDQYEQVDLVVNENFGEGMFSSIKCGMRALNCNRFFMTPGDYPMISDCVYAKLLEKESDVVIPSFNGRAGHPILVNGHCISQCLNIESFETMRDFIMTLEKVYVNVEDEGVILDLDTLEDYKVLKGRKTNADKG
jgi:molybdenum cofactor cytidylyltransferase